MILNIHLARRLTAGRLALPLLAVAAAVVLSACGGGDDNNGEEITVAASTGVLEDVARNVAGPDAEVVQIVPDGSSPHDFQLSARDRAEIEEADLLLENGGGLEAGIPLDEIALPRFTLTENVDQPRRSAAGDGGDPHVWMDPILLAGALAPLADALAEVDPDHADAYRRRAADYATELRELDAELEEALAAIPKQDRKLVTSHDSLGYFAERYGLEIVATVFPASGPEAEPSAEAIDELEREVRGAAVPALFAQEDDDPEVLRRVASDTGARVVTDLLIESPGIAGGYIDMMRRDASLIRDALSG